MNDIPSQHRATAPTQLNCAVVTVSDSRTLETDLGGQTAVQLLADAGIGVAQREILPDEPDRVRLLLERLVDDSTIDAVLLTGGTGLSARDQTYETVTGMFTKQLPGYGELFRWLSYQEIGAAAMLSRATAGVIDKTLIVTMPGSPAAVRLAIEKLIAPELRHLVREIRR